MEFYEVIDARRTVRELRTDPVPNEVLERIIAAGMKAPTNDHQRNWEFVVLREKEEKDNALQFVKAFAEKQGENRMVSAPVSSAQKMYAYAMPRQYSMLFQSGCVILPFCRETTTFRASSLGALNSFASIWCVIENIFLATAAEGLACSMRIPVGNEWNQVREAVGVPEGYLMPCYIGLGYPMENGKVLEQVEREVKSVIHTGKW